MESSELSLLEISGEDDSLLHQLPSNDVVLASGFDFSPLQIPRSQPSTSSSGKKSNADCRVPVSPSSHGNKENLSNIDNKSGMHNLSVERQKMKKSRKNGGYNLRKSLAWDKAFFTEEGVLDPVELSMICGISKGDRLSVIDEERRESLIMTSDIASGSANKVTLEEKLFTESPSAQPSKTSTSPFLKRGSLSGNRLPVISRSSQKASANRGLNKSGSKPAVFSTPIAPSSQKRLLNTGTPNAMTRNSKIPKVPISKHPPSSSTSKYAPSSGSHLKSPGICQPAQKRASLSLPSNIKSASKAISISSGGIPKSMKPLGANARKDSTGSSSEMDSSTNHKARNADKVSNCSQNLKQSFPITTVESVNGTTSSRVSSHLPSNNGGCNKKDTQVEGVKPSGLRMPSPSMKFFSEGNKKSSTLKSSIPTSNNSEAADHISGVNQVKVRRGSLNHDAISKSRLRSQVTELCTTASLVEPTAHVEAKHGESNQHVVQRVVLEDKVPQPTKSAEFMKNPLNGMDNQCRSESAPSLTVEEIDTDKFVDINSKNPTLHQKRSADGNIMSTSSASCCEVQRTLASSANGEVSPTVDEEMGYSLSAMNDRDLLESYTDFDSQSDNHKSVVDSLASTSMLNDENTPAECLIDRLAQSNTEGSISVQLGDSKVLADDDSLLDMDEGDSDSEQAGNCSINCGIVGGAAYDHVDKEQGDLMSSGNLSTMKPGECAIEHDIGNNPVPHNENSNVSSPILKTSGSKEIADVDAILREPESTEMSNHIKKSFLELSNNDADQLPDLPFSLHGAEDLPLSRGDEMVDIGCQHASVVASSDGTEANINRSVESTQEGTDASIVKLPISERDDMGLNYGVLRKDNYLDRDEDRSNIEKMDDILQVHSSVQQVEFQIDPISCLFDKGNESTSQTDGGIISAEELETKCNSEGICCSYGVEATINGDDVTQVLNDDLIVNLATSKRDDMELNNTVSLEDMSLKNDQGRSNAEMSNDINEVQNRVEEVECQSDLRINCLSDESNNSTSQTDGAISAEELETHSSIEGICSQINRNIELTQVLNDDSVLLKDSSLKRDLGESNIQIANAIHHVHSSVEQVAFQTDLINCHSYKDENSTFQIDGSVSAEPETKGNTESICPSYGAEATINRIIEVAPVLIDDLMVNLATSNGDDVELNNSVSLKDCFLERDHGGSNIEVSNDIHPVHSTAEEVELQIDLINSLSCKGSNSTVQTVDRVYSEEPETICNMEGISSSYGAEAAVYRDNELTQVLNDDSFVNLAASVGDDMSVNNGELSIDSFLKEDQGGSNIEISNDIRQVHDSVEEAEFVVHPISCLSDKGNTSTFETVGNVSAEEPEPKCNMEGKFPKYGIEATSNRNVELTQVLNDASILNLATSERDGMEFNNTVLLKDGFLNDQEGGDIEMSNDIHQVHSSAEEIEFQIDPVNSVLDQGNTSTFQAVGIVSAQEPETNCSTEGMCPNYGTEATVNKKVELTQVLNDASIVSLASSERDVTEFNNTALMKDRFLNDQGGCEIEISNDMHQVHSSAEEVELQLDPINCVLDKGDTSTFQTVGIVSAQEPVTNCSTEGKCPNHGTEATIDRNVEITQVLNDASILNLATSERDGMEFNNTVLLNDGFLNDQGGGDTEISSDIHQVHSSAEEVEFQIDPINCVLDKGNTTTFQTVGIVSAQEPETNCSTEGRCPNYGTEANVNKKVELTQIQNDDSAVNLATFETDVIDLNNGVQLKDSFLERDQGGSNIVIADDINQLHSSGKEVDFQTDTVSCLSSNENSHDSSTNQTDGSVSAEEPETNCNVEGTSSLEEVNGTSVSTDNPKVTMPVPHAVPFSDEWLAAIESAGEEILTMKTGAVQHSPTEKSVPEPSPWSPVKRKTNQMIGPFDCTKHTVSQPDHSE